ncbi:class I tRNA ligase family protein [Helicobacter sp. T3_23-1056]
MAEWARGRVKSTLESSPKFSLDSNAKSSSQASDSERGNPKSPLPKLSKCDGGGLGGRVKSTANDSSTPYTPDDLANFYPNSLLITGFDILFFWVARMLFSGESLLGKLPFRDIYLHALVRDENGQKMSKSRGNVIDPLEMIDKYGADSLRFSLAYLCAQGRDIRLSSAQLEISKNFANKLFNATQFLRLYASQIDSSFNGFCEIDSIAQYQTPLGKYAKSRLNATTSELITALESYRFNDGASVLYRFLWGEFCDWCIELAKAQKEAIHELGAVLIDALKLLHPYMPFISEELYHSLKGQTLECAQSIMIAEFPSDIARDLEVEAEFESIKNAIISLRRLKASVDLANKPIDSAYIELQIFEKDENKRIIAENYIQKLAKTQQVRILTSREGVFVDENKFLASKNGFFIPPELNIKNCVVDIGEGVKSYLPLDNIDLAPILSRLEAQKQKLQKEREKLESNLKNDRFLSNAPKEVVAKLESSLQEVLQKLEKVQSEIKTLDRG